MTQYTPAKPIPEPDEQSQPFFDAAMRGELLLMKCGGCGAFRLPARQHCDECLSSEFTWEAAAGTGTVRSFGIMHQRYHPGFVADIPYNVTIVELDEGPQLPTNIVGVGNEEIRVGMRVRLEWERHSDVAIPKFRPV